MAFLNRSCAPFSSSSWCFQKKPINGLPYVFLIVCTALMAPSGIILKPPGQKQRAASGYSNVRSCTLQPLSLLTRCNFENTCLEPSKGRKVWDLLQPEWHHSGELQFFSSSLTLWQYLHTRCLSLLTLRGTYQSVVPLRDSLHAKRRGNQSISPVMSD